MRLPLAEPRRPARKAKGAAEQPLNGRRRVLVVDDNVDAARTLEALLHSLGHDVDVAHDGAAALEAARKRTPEVVLLDISMPGIDGLEVARRLREQPGFDGVRLAAVSGLGQDADRRRSREAGFDVHPVKPLSADDLRRVLEH